MTQDAARWRAQITELDQRIAAAEAMVEDARTAAAAAALNQGDVDVATRALAHARDVTDALRSARGEALRHLAAAEDDERAAARAAALGRARGIARERIALGGQIDAHFSGLDPMVRRWSELGQALARELAQAGARKPSEGTLHGGYRVRCAFWDRAPLTAQTMDLASTAIDHREPLAEIAAASVAHILKGDET